MENQMELCSTLAWRTVSGVAITMYSVSTLHITLLFFHYIYIYEKESTQKDGIPKYVSYSTALYMINNIIVSTTNATTSPTPKLGVVFRDSATSSRDRYAELRATERSPAAKPRRLDMTRTSSQNTRTTYRLRVYPRNPIPLDPWDQANTETSIDSNEETSLIATIPATKERTAVLSTSISFV